MERCSTCGHEKHYNGRAHNCDFCDLAALLREAERRESAVRSQRDHADAKLFGLHESISNACGFFGLDRSLGVNALHNELNRLRDVESAFATQLKQVTHERNRARGLAAAARKEVNKLTRKK